MTKILIAEDESALQEGLKVSLESEGFVVLTAGDGQTAIDLAISEHPDLILMDIMMPIKSGLEAIKELKADARTEAIPVMLLTNYSYGFMKEEAQYSGAAGYLVKANISLDKVTTAAKQVLAGTYRPDPFDS